jgi:Winged helix DNA-binding domain
MNNHQIAALRLHLQQISKPNFNNPKVLVAHLGAVQAQDYPMSKWAIGLRLPAATDATIEAALDAGELVRTHVMRPTWHIVSGEDVRWMLALTAKRIKAAFNSFDQKMGLDTALYNRANDLIVHALEGGKYLTRAEVMTYLEQHGIKTDPGRATHFMMNAELDALVCNGVMRGKEQTYALLDEKVPKGLVFSREEALAELAKRYFNSHSPATLQDFSWWSGLSMPDARAGIEAIRNTLDTFVFEEKTYFYPESMPNSEGGDALFFLPAFDEYCVSYTNRNAVFAPHHQGKAFTVNGIFKPIIVQNGQVIGVWKRTIAKNKVIVETTFFEESNQLDAVVISAAMQPFGWFLGLAVEVKGA